MAERKYLPRTEVNTEEEFWRLKWILREGPLVGKVRRVINGREFKLGLDHFVEDVKDGGPLSIEVTLTLHGQINPAEIYRADRHGLISLSYDGLRSRTGTLISRSGRESLHRDDMILEDRNDFQCDIRRLRELVERVIKEEKSGNVRTKPAAKKVTAREDFQQ